jgi:hypothetical protein
VSSHDFPIGFSELLRLDATQTLASTGRLTRKISLTTRVGPIYQERPAPHNSWLRLSRYSPSGRPYAYNHMSILVSYGKDRLLPIADAISERWSRDLPRLLVLDPLGALDRGRAVRSVAGRLVVTMDLTSPHSESPHLVETHLTMTHRDGAVVSLLRLVAGGTSFDPAHPQFDRLVLRDPRAGWTPLREWVSDEIEDLYRPVLARIPRSR